jgi:hypothetical protein
MLRRLTLGLAGLSLVAIVAACNSSNTNNINGGVGIGPDVPTSTLYAAISNTNGVSIYEAPLATGATASYQIGGSSTTFDGPQYLAFDTGDVGSVLNKSLWVTNYDASSGASSITVIKYLATGNVIPLQQLIYGAMGQPRGIAINPTTGDVAVAVVFPAAQTPALPSQLLIFSTADNGSTAPYATISGPSTGLNVPSGMSYDGNGNVFVANRQGASVESFVVPTPTPTPASTPSPTPTPSPTATPAVTPTPTTAPTPQVTYDVAPLTDITGVLTGLVNPTSVALDSAGNVYVSDAGNASIRVFAKGSTGNVAPTRVISGAATDLTIPLDVRVDSTGMIYVSDAGAQKILIFSATASGNVAPTVTLPVAAGVVGIGLSP